MNYLSLKIGNFEGQPPNNYLGFYLMGTGKTATAVSVNCRSEDTSATDDKNNGRPLDGDAKNGVVSPTPDNRQWSW